jgi:hypothetical protein
MGVTDGLMGLGVNLDSEKKTSITQFFIQFQFIHSISDPGFSREWNFEESAHFAVLRIFSII